MTASYSQVIESGPTRRPIGDVSKRPAVLPDQLRIVL